MELYWGWFSLAAVLIIVEVVSPTFFFLWPGMAAICVGILAMVAPEMGFTARLAIFAVLTAAFAIGWRYYLKRYPAQSRDSDLNQRGVQLIGQTGIVLEAIVNGRGRVRIGDSTWIAEGPDCPEHTPVTVESAKSTILQVRK